MRISDWSSDVCSSDVIARRLDAFDRVDIDAEDLAAILDVDQLLEAVRREFAAVAHILGRLGGDLGEHFLELLDLLYVALLGKSQPHAIARVGEQIGRAPV